MDWVEVQGKTVDVAVQAALDELGLESPEHAEVEIIREPQRGFLGFGGQDALVRVKPRPKKRRRRRRRKKPAGEDQSARGAGEKKGGRSGGGQKQQRQPRGSNQQGRAQESRKPKGSGRKPEGSMEQESREKAGRKDEPQKGDRGDTGPNVEEQAVVVKEFLAGLLAAFGLEGEVTTRIDDGAIYADVTGEQTEALVGSRGVILQSILELTRTVVQRKTRAGARIRLDIAGYTARRREALRIYTRRLAEQVLDDGNEVMLEPMNPADRKVVHDAVADIEGVRSYSEGEEPERSVVIGLKPGVEPRGGQVEEEPATDEPAEEASSESAEPQESGETEDTGETESGEDENGAGEGDDEGEPERTSED